MPGKLSCLTPHSAPCGRQLKVKGMTLRRTVWDKPVEVCLHMELSLKVKNTQKTLKTVMCAARVSSPASGTTV